MQKRDYKDNDWEIEQLDFQRLLMSAPLTGSRIFECCNWEKCIAFSVNLVDTAANQNGQPQDEGR